MLPHPITYQLRALKLDGMAQAIQEQQEQPQARELSFEERLTLLVDRELAHRDGRTTQRRLLAARLKVQAARVLGIDVLPGGLHLQTGGEQAALSGAAVAVGDLPIHEERQTLLEAEFARLGLLLLLLDGLGHPVELQGTELVGNRVWQHRNLSSGKDRSRGQRASAGSRLVPGGNRRVHARWRDRPPVALDLPARGEVRPGGA